MKIIDMILLSYFVLYIAIIIFSVLIALDQGCLFRYQEGSFGNENPYNNPITWAVILFLIWPVPLMVGRAISYFRR